MKRLLIYIIIALSALPSLAQKNTTFINYIDTYKEMAIDQMRRHNIPASITLAQGILESAAGQSYLAKNANNHFGIKVGGTWTGPWVLKDDETCNEKFRKYESPEESYEDHSLFLHKSRYANLFTLPITDYKGWAKGLKAAGYATNPQYPQLLIKLIEDYDLTQYDYYTASNAYDWAFAEDDDHNPGYTPANITTGQMRTITHSPRLNNGVAYVIARSDDNYETIAYEYNLDPLKLREYNEVTVNHSLRDGDIVYLAKKKKHAGASVRGKYHRVTAGDSMHSISQRYGVKFKKLYSWNKLPALYTPQSGDLILLK